MSWYIYILLCDKKTYYVGLTGTPHKRLQSHKRKENLGTKEFSSIELVYIAEFSTRRLAEDRERRLKGWTVAKKKALIDGDLVLLKRLSKTSERVGGSRG